MGILFVEELEVEVVRKAIKNLHIHVHPPDGRVTVSVPWRASKKWIRQVVGEKLQWIRHHRAKILSQPPPSRKEYRSGEQHEVFGVKYPLLVKNANRSAVTVRNEILQLEVPSSSTIEQRAMLLQKWYRQQLKQLVAPMFDHWQARIGVEATHWGIRRMTRRWGSCYTQTRRIWLSLELAKRSVSCIEYVVVHELVHLLERLHNQRFYKYLTHFLPQWKIYEEELDRAIIG